MTSIIAESELEQVPLNYDLANVCSHVRVECPKKKDINTAFSSLGYSLTQTYYDPKLFKTDAPPEAIYDIFKQYKKNLSAEDPDFYLKGIKETTPSHSILTKPIEHEVSFKEEEGGKKP